MKFKPVLFAASLILSFEGMAADDVPKILAVQQAKLNNLNSSQFFIGSIQQSILSEEAFQKLAGPGWVLMKGQSIPTSALCKLASICTLPDASGRFLRNSGALKDLPVQAVGTLQDDDVNPGKITGTVDIAHDHGGHSHRAYAAWCAQAGVSASGGHPHAMRIADADRCSPSGSDIGSTSSDSVRLGSTPRNVTLKGGQETRPYNLTVNFFIKID